MGYSSAGRAPSFEVGGLWFESKCPSMKIIFLDIDGVLNSANWMLREQESGRDPQWSLFNNFDLEAIAVLNEVVEKTQAKVVISSSWRIIHPLEHIVALLKKHDFKGEVIGKTPSRTEIHHKRGNEIQEWLDAHPEAQQFVIIDDDSDMEHLMPKLVQTTWQDGLKAHHTPKILEQLK